MSNSVPPEPMPHVAAKLSEARRAAGLSTRAVAERLGRRFAISHATIANYEKSKSVPSLGILTALADFYERPINWFLEPGETLIGIRYRNLRSKVRVAERHQFEASAQRWIEAYVKLEQRLNKPLGPPANFEFTSTDSCESIAAALRQLAGIKAGEPVPSVSAVLERFGIRAIEVPTKVAIDGLAARYGNHFVVALNPSISNDRGRMNGAHELGHIAEGDCAPGTANAPELETRSFNIASHFLLPQAQLEAAFEGRSLVRMVQFKERFGISLAAMVYRAEQCGLIPVKVARHLWIEFSRRGWRRKEPGYVRPDRAIRFEDMLDSAIQTKRISWRDAETITGIKEAELQQRLQLAMGLLNRQREEEGDEPPPQILKLHR